LLISSIGVDLSRPEGWVFEGHPSLRFMKGFPFIALPLDADAEAVKTLNEVYRGLLGFTSLVSPRQNKQETER
jgi:hypothetical protein